MISEHKVLLAGFLLNMIENLLLQAVSHEKDRMTEL